jgi:putative spermidine/putrescine transport system permease protein
VIPNILAIAVAVFLLAPILIVVPMSFSTAISFEFPPPGYWLGYYYAYFNNPGWLQPTFNSFVISICTTVLTLVVVIPASFGYVRHRFRGKSAVNLLIMLPLIVPNVVAALAYYGFLSLGRMNGTIPGVVIAHAALAIPVTFLVICATLKGFDRNLERAAMISGAGPLRTFFHVTLPVLRPGMIVGGLFAFLSSFNEAVVVIFIGGRDAATLPKKMFESIRLESDPIIAVVSTLLIVAVLLGVLTSALLRKRPNYAT